MNSGTEDFPVYELWRMLVNNIPEVSDLKVTLVIQDLAGMSTPEGQAIIPSAAIEKLLERSDDGRKKVNLHGKGVKRA